MLPLTGRHSKSHYLLLTLLALVMFGEPERSYSQTPQPKATADMQNPQTAEPAAAVLQERKTAEQPAGIPLETWKPRAVLAAAATKPMPEKDADEPIRKLKLDRYQKHKVVATGYYAGLESTGKKPGHPQYGITYSGVKVRRDLFSTIAADPKVFSIGTVLYIPGYGFGVVADTGSAIKGDKIDLYFNTKQDIYDEWGKRKVDVYIVRKGDGKVTERMLDRLNAVVASGEVEAAVSAP